jgi:hypothetical protein
MPSLYGSLVIDVKLKAMYRFHAGTILFHIFQEITIIITITEVTCVLKITAMHHFSIIIK